MELGLKGRVAVITGPAKGLGAAVSLGFAQEGADLALLGRDTDAIEPVAQEARAMGVRALVIGCDMTDEDACTKAVAQVDAEFGGRIDILVNVAGGSGPIGKTGAETSADEFDEIVLLNMRGPFNMIRAVTPTMQSQSYGRIVNVGGTFGLRGKAGRLAYSASKWGLRGVTKSFALELGGYGITVNNVAPGMVDGPRFRTKVVPEMAARLGISEHEAVERHAADYALRRISTDQDVADACLFLASDRARQITGADLAVDGGWAAL
ncbi:MAG: SDR family oxidoreductase [Rhodobacteraceae bacterium]|nr:MAG: SDR family oxidoreductase [Paracoccaceae bacterium]